MKLKFWCEKVKLLPNLHDVVMEVISYSHQIFNALMINNLIHSVITLTDSTLSTGLNNNKNFWQNFIDIFLPIIFNICYGCSKDPPHQELSR